MYRVRLTEPGVYTVGSYEDGTWHPESDHPDAASAARRVHYLNGGAGREDESDPEGGGLATRANLREWYAGQALAGLLASCAGSTELLEADRVARWAFEYANAMLARSKKE